MIREILYAGVALILFAYVAEAVYSSRDDPREPPRLKPKVPLIGHAIGLVRHGSTYFSLTSKRTNAEIYTLGIFGFKIYVSSSTRLTPLIQKQGKTLSFRPFIQLAARKIGNASDETYDLFSGGLVDNLGHAQTHALAPGPELDAQNLRMGRRVIVDVDGMMKSASGSMATIKLLEWVKHAIVQASSCGIFGEEHMFRRPEVEEAFWTWQTFLPMHMTGLPIVGRKGYIEREKVFDAFRTYLTSVPDDASHVARERWRIFREAGMSEDEIAKQEATFPVAIFANSVPACYWTIWELFSRPALLAEVRQELETQAVRGSKDDGFVLDVAALKTKCPVILSVFQETQRTRHVHAVIRSVKADTILDDKYLVKAGNYLQMPGAPVHRSTKIWGDSAPEFNSYRFISKDDRSQQASVAGGTFLSWGAQPHLCPARQFATTEILILIALLAMRAELNPLGGAWERKPAVSVGDLTTVLNPKKEVVLLVGTREQWDGKWSLNMGESRTKVRLASG